MPLAGCWEAEATRVTGFMNAGGLSADKIPVWLVVGVTSRGFRGYGEAWRLRQHLFCSQAVRFF